MSVHLCYKLKRVYMTKIKGRGISNWRNLMCKDGKDMKIRKDGEKEHQLHRLIMKSIQRLVRVKSGMERQLSLPRTNFWTQEFWTMYSAYYINRAKEGEKLLSDDILNSWLLFWFNLINIKWDSDCCKGKLNNINTNFSLENACHLWYILKLFDWWPN